MGFRSHNDAKRRFQASDFATVVLARGGAASWPWRARTSCGIPNYLASCVVVQDGELVYLTGPAPEPQPRQPFKCPNVISNENVWGPAGTSCRLVYTGGGGKRVCGTGRRHGMSICSLGLRWWGWCRDFSNRKRVCCANRILQARAASASRICLTSRLQRATDLAKPQTSQAQLSNDQVSYWLHHTCLLLAHLAFASHCERSLPRETNRTCLVCSL